jgi:hypothetical protein
MIPLVCESQVDPPKVTRHSMARKQKRQAFVCAPFSGHRLDLTNGVTHEGSRKDADRRRHFADGHRLAS